MILSGYTLEKLTDDGDLRLSRATAEAGAASILVLTPAGPAPSTVSLARLQHIHGLRDQLDPAWATRPQALEHRDGRPILVFEDPGGAPLVSLVGSPWDLTRFLHVACSLAAALGRLHARDLVHKDIRPANILVRLPDGGVSLTGFGIASRLPRERQSPEPPEVIAGDLCYMAPEQTGRVSRSIDSRSDLYSLGITFYEMLSGAPPFRAADPIEWIHCHIARPPAPLTGVPEPLAAIVVKLLAKTAEDRYQTAAGLEADLRLCLADWQSRARIDPFPLGAHDTSDRLLIPERLYGRDADVDAIHAAYDRVVARGAPELVLVSGYSGIGKSSVVNELHGALLPSRGLFAAGKFDQYRRDIPYATLAQAFQSLVQQVLGQSDAELSSWRDQLIEALGPNGQLLINLIPELELVIGKQPPVPELPPQDAKNRFQLAFRNLVGVFARKQHPLVVFLDDLQWVDSATLELMERLITDTEVRHLLLVGAYRDNEVGLAHPLHSTLSRIRDQRAAVLELVLGPMSTGDLEQLVADSLHTTRGRAAPLADLIHQKTGGNPFFAIQFLTVLSDEGLIGYDHGRAIWTWDLERIHAKGFTDNVVDLMIAKLDRLALAARGALRQLACLGNVTPIATLELVHGPELDEAMWEAVRAGLVFRRDGQYGFLHDRVQEAAYALIPEGERAGEHLRIGRLLVAHLPEDEIDEKVFEIANQLNRGAAFIDDGVEKLALARLNARAGLKAKGAIAYVSARNHLAQAVALVPADTWTRSYRETFDLYLVLAECEYLVGNFARADELFDLLLERAESNLDKASVFGLRMRLYQVAGKYDEGFSVALRALQLFGVTFPEREADIGPAMQAELAEIPVHLGKRAIGDLVDAPLATDPQIRAVINLLSEAAPCAYIGRPMLFPLVTLRAVNLSLRHGNTDLSSYVYAVYALMLVGPLGDSASAFEFSEMSLRLNDKLGNARLRGTLLHLHGDHIRFWRRPFAEGFPILEQAFIACLEVGDLVYAGFLAFETVWQLIENGDRLEDVQSGSARFAAFAQQTHNQPIYETIRLEQQFVACLQGRTRGPQSFDDPDGVFDEAGSFASVVKATFGCGIFFHHCMKQIVAYLHGQHAEALRCAALAEPVLGAALAMPIEATYHFFHALTLVALLPKASPEDREAYRRLLDGKLARLARWAGDCPQNFGARHALVQAELARVDGRVADAMRLYEEAVRSARDNRLVHNEAMAHELAARFYSALGIETCASAHAAGARHAYGRWGAQAMVLTLERDFPRSVEEVAAPARGTVATPVAELDLATVVKVSQAVSAELVLDALIERLMVIAVENAGAGRGLLIRPRDGELHFEAEAVAHEDGVTVRLGTAGATVAEAPESILRYVARSHESVILDDASAPNRFSTDAYVGAARARSILCLPLVKQTRLIGLLYLENNLTPHVFTPRRIALLELLASQAAISLENARLHAQLRAAEDQVRSALRENRVMVDTIPGQVWCTRPDGSVEYLNRPWLDYTGLSMDEARDAGWTVALHPEDRPRVLKRWRSYLASGQPGEVEARLRRHDGAYRWFLLRGAPLVDEQGRISRWYGTNADIEDLKLAESALRRSEVFLNEAQHISQTGSFTWDPASGEITWSQETYRIYEIDPSVKPTQSIALARAHPEDAEHTREVLERAAREGLDWHDERRLLMPDGRVKHVQVIGHAWNGEDGRRRFAGVVKDVTLVRIEEARLQRALAEKEALLKEVHHRVKNNLQLISSLLNLQADRSDSHVADLLAESRNRIHSMALVHENLYRAGDFGRVRMAGHITKLCQQLSRAYSDSHRVAVRVTSSDLHLDIDRAVTCGLIVNELVSNALKHAFPDGRAGGVSVELAPGEGRRHVLTVRDDGVGLPTDLDLARTDSLGLQLVNDLAAQLHATIDVSRDGGTAFRISFETEGPVPAEPAS